MNNLTNNLRTHILVLRDWRQFNITKQQYWLIRMDRQDNKRSDFFTLTDSDTNEVLFDWEYWDIKEFKERKIDKDLGEKRWVCSFWTRHSVIWFPDNCECSKKFNTLWIMFKDELKKLWYNINYDSDITEEMQEHFLRNNLDNNK